MIAITGATGQLGHLIVGLLLQEVEPDGLRALGRNADKAADLIARGVSFRRADYNEPQTLAGAFEGISKLVFVSGSEVGKRVAQHAAVVDAAKAAGVGLIAYTSILHADTSPVGLATEHRATEAALKASGIPCVLLRNGWYNENYALSIPVALEHGLMGCAGDGRISAASRADYAAAAARVVLDNGHAGRTYELAGDTAFTMPELAAEIARQSGKSVTYTNLTREAYADALVATGFPPAVAQMLADADAGVARDALFEDGKQLSGLTGRPTTPISETVSGVLAGAG